MSCVHAVGRRGLTALVCLALARPALAQATGSIRGTVADAAGTGVPGVTIVVEGATGRAGAGSATLSDASGVFAIAFLAPGTYVVHATFPGVAPVDVAGIEIQPGRSTQVRMTLPATAIHERVEVRATPQVVRVEETTTETRFGSETIDLLPILGRDYQDILTLAPGVSDDDGDGNPNIHGARDTDVVTLLDGVSTNDPLTGKVGAQLNIESIQEIEIKTSGASAEFGRAQGGFANIITKSGGNQFEGAFKLFVRTYKLDGDGAGVDDPTLHGGLGRPAGTLEFTDLMPFVSLGGPIVKDHAWFFGTVEYIQKQDPINALNQAFVAGTREFRTFAKFTWQASPSHRLALSINADPQEYDNLGLNSFTREETGFTDRAGGLLVTARATSVLTANTALESTVSWFEGHPERIPNSGPDANGDGILFRDDNGDGFHDFIERDFGEDWDGDHRYDVHETRIDNGKFLGAWNDYDFDGRRTLPGECEGRTREDLDCDGHLDNVNEDRNGNGVLDDGEDIDGDGHLDLGTEDRNHNGELDDTPFPTTLYPYGSLTPLGPDKDYSIDQSTGAVSGPFHQDYQDDRGRFTLRQDLSLYVPEARGTHDFKSGYAFERETFTRDLGAREIVGTFVPPHDSFPPFPGNHPRYGLCGYNDKFPCPQPIRVSAVLPTQDTYAGAATGNTMGLYFQDTYKPLPNLSLGLGLRYDRETTEAPGYTPVDPRGERATFNRLNAFIGTEALYSDDNFVGDGNGIISLGITGDPIFLAAADPKIARADLIDGMAAAMPRLFMGNHTDVSFGSETLAKLLPDVVRNGRVDPDLLRQAGVLVQTPEDFRLTNDNLAPRLSVSWDPAADGKTKLFGTWGRYYDKLFLSTIVGEQGPDYVNRYYLFSNLAYRDLVQPHHLLSAASNSPPSTIQIDRQLATPFTDEFTLGFEREIAPETSVSLTWVHRDFRRQLQDTDVNHSVRYDAQGRPVDLVGRLVTVENPSQPGSFTTHRVKDGRPDLYINNPFFNQVLEIGNTNAARYGGFELELKRRLARRWQMQASYTYSRAVGQAEDFQSRLGNDPSTTEFEFGNLSYDQRHVVKVNAVTYLPRDWQLGSAVSWSSGLPYSIISRFFALDNVDYQQLRTRFGYTDFSSDGNPVFVPVRRNSQRNDPVLDINVRAQKAIVIGRTSGSVVFEIYNLLNSDDLRIYSYEPTPDSAASAITPDNPTVRGPIQVDAVRRFGRRFEVGIQLTW